MPATQSLPSSPSAVDTQHFNRPSDSSSNQSVERAHLKEPLDRMLPSDAQAAGRIRRLRAVGEPQHEALAAALCDRTQLTGVEVLDLRGQKMGNKGATYLSDAPHFSSVVRLLLADNAMGSLGFTVLAQVDYFTRLRTLDLSDNHLGEVGCLAWGEVGHYPALRHLKLNRCLRKSADRGAAFPARLLWKLLPPYGGAFLQLEALQLAGNGLRNLGVEQLWSTDRLPALRYLDLSDNDITEAGGRRMADQACFLGALQVLRLSGNPLRLTTLLAILRSRHLPRLRRVDCAGCAPKAAAPRRLPEPPPPLAAARFKLIAKH